MRLSTSRATAIVFLAFAVAVPPAAAATIAIGDAAFGPGSNLITFTGLADGTEVDGLVLDGIVFDYSLGAGQVIIDGGPGVTNNVAPPNVVSVDNPNGVLTLIFPSLIDRFGYGYAVLSTDAVPNATTISLFNGAAAVGSLSYNGVPDPTFSGGFAGIQSTLLFNRAELTFNAVPAFAVDNVRTQLTDAAAIPEPGTLILFGSGLMGMALRRARRRTTV
jgi:PEP-CTERM motif